MPLPTHPLHGGEVAQHGGVHEVGRRRPPPLRAASPGHSRGSDAETTRRGPLAPSRGRTAITTVSASPSTCTLVDHRALRGYEQPTPPCCAHAAPRSLVTGAALQQTGGRPVPRASPSGRAAPATSRPAHGLAGLRSWRPPAALSPIRVTVPALGPLPLDGVVRIRLTAGWRAGRVDRRCQQGEEVLRGSTRNARQTAHRRCPPRGRRKHCPGRRFLHTAGPGTAAPDSCP